MLASKIKKNNTYFFVVDSYKIPWCPNGFFNDHIQNGDWENETLCVIDLYADATTGVYVDIGSWIGPTVLYAAGKYKKVLAFEPDPKAIEMLEKNLSVNDFNNVTLIKKAIAGDVGKIRFGGNGPTGNSESSMLVSDAKDSELIEVDATTLESALEKEKINPEDIRLIKMDIEGGEAIVVPALKKFLETYKPNLHISLHREFLDNMQIDKITGLLFDIYGTPPSVVRHGRVYRQLHLDFLQGGG